MPKFFKLLSLKTSQIFKSQKPKKAKLKCPVCDKDFGFLSKKFNTFQCSTCSNVCHKSCSKIMVDSHVFQTERNIKKERFCLICSEKNASYFKDDRYCKQCGADNVSAGALCDRCGKFGHDSCYARNANSINQHLYLIYPHKYKIQQHTYLCEFCTKYLDNELELIRNYPDPKVTRGDYLKDYEVIKEIRSLKTNEYDLLDDAERELILYSKQLGGNAIFNYYYNLRKETVRLGYSKNGNPYYGTVKHYTAEGRIVQIRRKKRVRATPNHLLVLPDTNVWLDFSPNLIDFLKDPLKIIVPDVIYEEIDHIKSNNHKDAHLRDTARIILGHWEFVTRSESGRFEKSCNTKSSEIINSSNNSGSKWDYKILEHVHWYAAQGNLIYFISNDSGILINCRELARHEKLNIECGRFGDFVNYIGNSDDGNLVSISKILRRKFNLNSSL